MGKVGLSRHLSLLGLASTGICSMLGASIYVVPFMIQRNVPGIGPYVLPAFLFAAVPAVLAAFSYAILGSSMPRAGGSYLYASRGLSPYLGFIASFSQWFGLTIAIGVISYVIIPFFRDIAIQLQMDSAASLLDTGWVRVLLALSLLWTFVYINIRGVRTYEKTLIPLMLLMFGLGAVVVVAGMLYNHNDFFEATAGLGVDPVIATREVSFDVGIFLTASALLFSSFIGFDSIAQAGGEAKDPARSIPAAIIIAIVSVGCFYFVFTKAVYHAIPWQFVAEQAQKQDITAAGMLGYLLPAGWAIVIVTGAAIALLNDLPAMILSVSRLMFAWAEDGIFPKAMAHIDDKFHTPKYAIIASGVMASIGIFGSHFAGDFFLGIDIMVTSMLVNFFLMCVTVITLPHRNKNIYASITAIKDRRWQLAIAMSGCVLLMSFLIIHISKDLSAKASAWYFHSTPVWVIVMIVAIGIYWNERRKRKASTEGSEVFSKLPDE